MKLQHFSNLWNHPSNRGRRLRALGRVAMWQVRKRLSPLPFKLPIFYNLRLLCYPKQGGSSIMLYWGGWPDYDDMYFVARYLRPGDAVIDVGANIGIYSLLAAARVGAAGRVLALEPGSTTFPVLLENAAINGLTQIEARCLAVGPVDGEVRFLKRYDLTNRIVAADESQDDSSTATVPCAQLDTLLDRPYALGKIDIEGSEPLAFAGGAQSLAAGNPPVWLMEFKDRLLRKFGWTAERFKQVMEGHGYRLGVYSADRNELTFPSLALDQLDNILAVKESAIEAVHQRLATCELHVPGAPFTLRK